MLAEYGTGAVMGVPAHDQRDIAFAQSNGLPIQQVIDAEGAAEAIAAGQAWTDAGTCLLYTSPSPRDQRGSRMPSSA